MSGGGVFADKVALVTGAASGIGAATAERLAAEGAMVVVADVNDEAGEKVAAQTGGRYVHLDVADASAWAGLVTGVLAEVGVPAIAHLNAGVTTRHLDEAVGEPGELPEFSDLTDSQCRRITGANVDGVVFGIRALVPAMEAAGGGAIVATASLAGVIPFSPDPIYTGTKHFVVGLVRSLADVLRPKDITLNAVCPGVVDTPLLGDLGRQRFTEAGLPLIQPSEIADAVVAAATSGASGACYVCRAGKEPHPHEFADPLLF